MANVPTNRPNRAVKRRTPVGRRNVLKAESRHGFKRRFVNDDPERIRQMLDAGYTIVENTEVADANVGSASALGSVSGKPVGNGRNAVLMEIKEDWYEEDQAAKQKLVTEKESGLLADEDGATPNQTNLYGDGLSIKSNRKAPGRPTIKAE